MASLFDTHAHLDQADFEADRAAVVQRARDAGVAEMLAVGTTAANSRTCVELAAAYPGVVYASVGIHPNHAAEAGPGDFAEVERLAESPHVVAIGETGLDRHWDFTPFDLQREYFDRHIRLAALRGLPFIVHMRDCEADIVEVLRTAWREGGRLRGVMHSFTGDATLAAECVGLGLHISFAGMVTYKKADALRACAATIPLDRLLVETDSPYLSPEPVRNIRRNEPAHVRHTAQCVAAARGMGLEELAEQTTANARRLFGVG